MAEQVYSSVLVPEAQLPPEQRYGILKATIDKTVEKARDSKELSEVTLTARGMVASDLGITGNHWQETVSATEDAYETSSRSGVRSSSSSNGSFRPGSSASSTRCPSPSRIPPASGRSS